MNTDMTPIKKLSPVSLAKVSAIYYAVGGLLTLVIDLAAGMEVLKVPLGFLTLFLGLKIDFTYHRALWMPGVISQLFFSTILYALTGWVTGFLGALIYNFVSDRFNVRIKGTTDLTSA